MRADARVVVVLFLVGGCNSSDPGSTDKDCLGKCPAGTRCENDRCVPVCVPPCATDETCGADHICHKGQVPDAVVVPPPDIGPPDADSTASDQGVPPKTDSGDPNKPLCDCLAKQPKNAYCAKVNVTCQIASDCCQPGSLIPCGTYGNKYACVAGKCELAGCGTKGECVTYAQAIKQPDANNWTCQPSPCPGGRAYCSQAIKSCTKQSDCCSSGAVPCGIYTNHWTCDAGQCKYAGCASDNECKAYAQTIGAPNGSSYVCRTNACYNTGYCIPQPKACTSATDCCNPKTTIPCGVYTNRYRCESNECVLDGCKDKQDCLSYAVSLKLPDAKAYNCVAY